MSEKCTNKAAHKKTSLDQLVVKVLILAIDSLQQKNQMFSPILNEFFTQWSRWKELIGFGGMDGRSNNE